MAFKTWVEKEKENQSYIQCGCGAYFHITKEQKASRRHWELCEVCRYKISHSRNELIQNMQEYDRSINDWVANKYLTAADRHAHKIALSTGFYDKGTGSRAT